MSVAFKQDQEREYRAITVPVELRSDDTGNGGFSGYANLAGVVDEYRSIFEPGCYRNLEELKRDGFISLGHNWTSGIGIITDYRSDEKGLWISAEFHSDEESQKIRKRAKERIDAGKTVALSIGFFTNESKDETRDGETVRVMTSIDVVEVALVMVPGTKGSQISELRGGMTFAQEYETVRDAVAGLTRRIGSLAELRTSLSEEKQTQIVTLADDFDKASAGLRALILPKVEAPDDVALAELEAAYLAIEG